MTKVAEAASARDLGENDSAVAVLAEDNGYRHTLFYKLRADAACSVSPELIYPYPTENMSVF